MRRTKELVPTNTIVLTFCKSTLPKSIKAGYLNIPVEPFVPNPLRCFRCKKIWLWSKYFWQADMRTRMWQMEKRIHQVRVEKRLSFYDAKKLVETTQPAMMATSYVAVVKTTTRSVSVNTDLNSGEKYSYR